MRKLQTSSLLFFLAFITLTQGTAFSATAYEELLNPMKQVCDLGAEFRKSQKILETIRKLKKSASKMSASEANRQRLTRTTKSL